MEKSMKEAITHPIFLLTIVYIFFPFFLPYLGGYTALATEILIFSIYCLAYNLMLGFTGLMSFGHGCLFGIGAYTLGLTQRHFFPGHIWAPLILGAVASGIAAFLIGRIIIRKSGIYFGLLTVAFTQMFFVIAFRWTEVTGGEDGFAGIVRTQMNFGLFSLNLKNPYIYYYFVLFFYLASMIFLWRLVNSPFGRVLKGIRFNRDRTLFLGYNIYRYRLIVMTISGVFSGLAGAFHALLVSSAFAENMTWMASGDVVMMTILGGGLSNFFGPILGAAIFLILQDLVSAVTQHWLFIFGLFFVFIVLFLPEGILGFFSKEKEEGYPRLAKLKSLLKP